jgi:hypothetical protein
MSPTTVEYMIWNHTHDMVDEVMVHPSGGEILKHFNRVHPQFSVKSRNMHLELCTYGNP